MGQFDNILKDWGLSWGDKLSSRLGQPTSNSGKVTKSRSVRIGGVSSPLPLRAKVEGVMKKKPEVMVKIAKSGWKKSNEHVKAHIEYITRNGKLELETSDEETIKGKNAAGDWVDDLELDDEGRQGVSMIFSMPKGTDAQQLKKAVAEFCKEEFEGRKWAYVLHSPEEDDKTNQPHCHVFIKNAEEDTMRKLRIHKSTLQSYRESFAVKLEAHGIQANATPRSFRAARNGKSDYHRVKVKPCPEIAVERAKTRDKETIEMWGDLKNRIEAEEKQQAKQQKPSLKM